MEEELTSIGHSGPAGRESAGATRAKRQGRKPANGKAEQAGTKEPDAALKTKNPVQPAQKRQRTLSKGPAAGESEIPEASEPAKPETTRARRNLPGTFQEISAAAQAQPGTSKGKDAASSGGANVKKRQQAPAKVPRTSNGGNSRDIRTLWPQNPDPSLGSQSTAEAKAATDTPLQTMSVDAERVPDNHAAAPIAGDGNTGDDALQEVDGDAQQVGEEKEEEAEKEAEAEADGRVHNAQESDATQDDGEPGEDDEVDGSIGESGLIAVAGEAKQTEDKVDEADEAADEQVDEVEEGEEEATSPHKEAAARTSSIHDGRMPMSAAESQSISVEAPKKQHAEERPPAGEITSEGEDDSDLASVAGPEEPTLRGVADEFPLAAAEVEELPAAGMNTHPGEEATTQQRQRAAEELPAEAEAVSTAEGGDEASDSDEIPLVELLATKAEEPAAVEDLPTAHLEDGGAPAAEEEAQAEAEAEGVLAGELPPAASAIDATNAIVRQITEGDDEKMERLSARPRWSRLNQRPLQRQDGRTGRIKQHFGGRLLPRPAACLQIMGVGWDGHQNVGKLVSDSYTYIIIYSLKRIPLQVALTFSRCSPWLQRPRRSREPRRRW